MPNPFDRQNDVAEDESENIYSAPMATKQSELLSVPEVDTGDSPDTLLSRSIPAGGSVLPLDVRPTGDKTTYGDQAGVKNSHKSVQGKVLQPTANPRINKIYG